MTIRRRFDTLAVHAGGSPDPATGARSVPIYQTTSFVFRDADHAADLFALEEPGFIYTRIGNPTLAAFEERVAALEGGLGALAVSSGQAAATYALLTIAGAGDEIVAGSSLYGGTYTLFSSTLRRFGVRVLFVDSADPDSFARAINDRTKALYVETIGNPSLDVPDLRALGQLAEEAGVPLIVDNTFASPYLCRPFEHGAHIVVHSTTKYIGGHGTSIGGGVVDSGRFDWTRGRFPELCEPDPTYHGLIFVEKFGPAAFIAKARLQLLRDLGSCMSPFNAFLFIQGLETLSLRMRRHSESALAIARHLEGHPAVTWVSYPGLPSHPSYEKALRYLPKGQGGILVFGVRGGYEAGKRLLSSLSLFSLLANVGDARSLIIHPASTTHAQLTPEERARGGVTDDMIRISVGLEDVQDLIEDLDDALGRVTR